MKYNKLVRDKIPEKIEQSGNKAIYRTLDYDEYKEYLEKKLDEEVAEFHESKSGEELADILEVLASLIEIHLKETGENVIGIARDKRAIHGSFDKRLLLIEVEK